MKSAVIGKNRLLFDKSNEIANVWINVKSRDTFLGISKSMWLYLGKLVYDWVIDSTLVDGANF